MRPASAKHPPKKLAPWVTLSSHRKGFPRSSVFGNGLNIIVGGTAISLDGNDTVETAAPSVRNGIGNRQSVDINFCSVSLVSQLLGHFPARQTEPRRRRPGQERRLALQRHRSRQMSVPRGRQYCRQNPRRADGHLHPDRGPIRRSGHHRPTASEDRDAIPRRLFRCNRPVRGPSQSRALFAPDPVMSSGRRCITSSSRRTAEVPAPALRRESVAPSRALAASPLTWANSAADCRAKSRPSSASGRRILRRRRSTTSSGVRWPSWSKGFECNTPSRTVRGLGVVQSLNRLAQIVVIGRLAYDVQGVGSRPSGGG